MRRVHPAYDDVLANSYKDKEREMEATDAVQMPFHLLAGLGLFFIGVGVLWFVTVYKEFQTEE